MTENQVPAFLINIISSMMERETGQSPQNNRHWRIEPNLAPVIRRHNFSGLSQLVKKLQEGNTVALRTECIDALVNNETSFFRDQTNFALLTGPVLDALHHSRKNSQRIRIWCSACSTGQEVYSLAMALAENRDKWRGWKIEIVGTDISAFAINKATAGQYTQFEIQRGLPVTMMLKYCEKRDNDWVIQPAIRDMVLFQNHNMLANPDFLGKFDLILCRNMLMYLTQSARLKTLRNIASVANDGAFLMLGSAETIIGQSNQFMPSREFRGTYQLV